MRIELSHRLPAPLGTVMELLADEDFVLARAAASGAQQADAVVDGGPTEGFTVSIRRIVPAESIPEEARSLVGGSLSVKYTEVWEEPGDDAAREGTFALEILGTPGRVAGLIRAEADGEATVVSAHGEVVAPVPLFGALIERAVADAVRAGFAAEFAAADAWLADSE